MEETGGGGANYERLNATSKSSPFPPEKEKNFLISPTNVNGYALPTHTLAAIHKKSSEKGAVFALLSSLLPCTPAENQACVRARLCTCSLF